MTLFETIIVGYVGVATCTYLVLAARTMRALDDVMGLLRRSLPL